MLQPQEDRGFGVGTMVEKHWERPKLSGISAYWGKEGSRIFFFFLNIDQGL